LTRISRMLCLLVVAFVAIPLCAESKNPADYPLRLHIFTSSEVTFYHNRFPDESRGDGRANLFENGEPRGLDFSFDCSQKIKPSFGFETYPAKWKQKDAQLIVLFPVFGKSNAYFTCTLRTQVKEYAYVMLGGRLTSEPTTQFKAWMVNHDYDPEHGKNTPRLTEAAVVPSRLDEARRRLTGDHKDTEKARKQLLEIVQGDKADSDAETLVWADIYLGYIEDRANNRQSAIGWYEKALAVEGAPPGSVSVAKSGLRQPLVWIRHLDAAAQLPAKSSYDH
jgi:hypothetical protein